MKPFLREVLVAAGFALVGAIAYAGLSALVGAHLAVRLVAVGIGGAYVLYLLQGAAVRTGRIAVFAGWLVATAGLSVFAPSLAVILISQVLLISIVRMLYHHTSALAALLDLGLSAFALAALVWASAKTGSFFLATWSFFLVQALFASIPSEFGANRSRDIQSPESDQFDRAFRAADAAIRRIAIERSQ
jgi:hypothetical protein